MAKDLRLKSANQIIGMTDYDLIKLKSEADFFRTCDVTVMKNHITQQFYDSTTLADKQIDFYVIKSPLFDKNSKTSAGIVGISYYYKVNQLIYTSCSELTIDSVSLNPKEIKVLQLLIRGHTAKQIAEKINLSKRTIENKLANIKIKFNVNSKSELIEKLIDHFK